MLLIRYAFQEKLSGQVAKRSKQIKEVSIKLFAISQVTMLPLILLSTHEIPFFFLALGVEEPKVRDGVNL